jgi:hypothetical protein
MRLDVAATSLNSEANRISPQVYRRLPQPDHLQQFVGPDFEADQGIWPESLGNWNVRGIAALGDQDAADPRNVVSWPSPRRAEAFFGNGPFGALRRWQRKRPNKEERGIIQPVAADSSRKR